MQITPSDVRSEIAAEKVQAREPLPFVSSLSLADFPALLRALEKNKPLIQSLTITPERGGSVVSIKLDGFLKEKKEFRIDDSQMYGGKK
jgi:hypothetical protein